MKAILSKLKNKVIDVMDTKYAFIAVAVASGFTIAYIVFN